MTKAGNDATSRSARWITWLKNVLLMPYPTNEAARKTLENASIVKPLSLWKFKGFLLFVGLAYGSFGKEIRPSQETMAEEYGVSLKTVRRWLRAAVELGILKVVNKHRTTTNVYEINEFWLDLPPVTGDVDLAEVYAAAKPPPVEMGVSPLTSETFALTTRILEATSEAELERLEEENQTHWNDDLAGVANERRRELARV